MSTSKHTDKLCVLAILCAFLLMAVILCADALGIRAADSAMEYEQRLFDPQIVHTLDIRMDDWEGFLETCENEEYAACAVVIDGEAFHNVGIRAKGNTSLSTVSSMDSDRYSFKIEFDQYDSAKTYHGLDKLSLNNLIQDASFMKDYLTYQLMGQFGVSAPLCSYVSITVNGEPWGLYLAVEGIEDAFLQRNYGADHGALYKPDSMDFGGGRGNGREFDMDDFMNRRTEETGEQPPMQEKPQASGGRGGSAETLLQYVDEDPDHYSTIFESAKTDLTDADKQRLVEALRTLSGDQPDQAVNVEQMIRYFVVHNFVVNGDSYTGSMIHNYYLYEQDGKLEMLPWDYNLAFGTFQGHDASSAVNDPIDTPLSVDGSGQRPAIDWIFSDPEYTQLYHQYFAEFLEQFDAAAMVRETAALIEPHVSGDPTKFYTLEEFRSGAQALEQFCLLREESVSGQLKGTIPSTDEGQQADNTAWIDPGDLKLSDMGTMQMGGGREGNPPEMEGMPTPPSGENRPSDGMGRFDPGTLPFPNTPPGGMGGEAPPEQMPNSDGAQSADGQTMVLAAASALVLLLGCLAAWKYKGRR